MASCEAWAEGSSFTELKIKGWTEMTKGRRKKKLEEGMWKSIFRSDLTTVYNEHPGFSSESQSSQKLLCAACVLGSLYGASLGFWLLNQISAQHVLCILVVISAVMYFHKIFDKGASCLLKGAVATSIHLLGCRAVTDDQQPDTDTSPKWIALVFLPNVFSEEMVQWISTALILAYNQ